MEKKITRKDIEMLEFHNVEYGIRHHTHREDMQQYELVRAGDPAAGDEAVRMLSSNLTGHLCDNPFQNLKYLFACGAALATRICIQGGLAEETAYDISDLYIRKMDLERSREAVLEDYRDFFSMLSERMRELGREETYSLPVAQSISYIYQNLHGVIRTQDIAGAVHLNASYLATLFKKETGFTISEYVLNKKTDSAKNLLRYSPYSYLEIAEYLGFSSRSHFTQQFKKKTGYTPREYRNAFFRDSHFDE